MYELSLRRLKSLLGFVIISATALTSGYSQDNDVSSDQDDLLKSDFFATDGEPVLGELPPLRISSELLQTDVLPHMEGEISPSRNYVYCATFKLAWQDLSGRFTAPPSSMEQALSRNKFSESDLDPNCFLTITGTPDSITQIMKDRFPDTRLNLPDVDLTENMAFAYLQKSLPFRERFDRVESPLMLKTTSGVVKVTGFGIEKFNEGGPQDTVHRTQVTIVDYRNKNDFVLELNTLSKRDHLILAKVPPKTTLEQSIVSIQSRAKAGYSRRSEKSQIQEGESIIVPIISVGVIRQYQELNDSAYQAIQFRLDESGAKLKSYGGYGGFGEDGLPREFVFDSPFFLYLVEQRRKNPYLAMWVANEEVLVDFIPEENLPPTAP